MAQRSGLTRGDRRRNDRIEVVRAVIRPDRAILAIDLGEEKQVAALMDHDGRVLGRRTVLVKAHALGGMLAWAAGQAARHGFASVVVGCEPTGHRWRSVMQLADDAGLGFVCVQSLRVHLAREADDYTRDKTDHKDAVLIGKLIARLDCYLPERADADWARLRHLGARRVALVTEAGRCRQQIADLLGCCWPAALAAAVKPLDSTTWLACLSVVVDAGADLPGLAADGVDAFTMAARAYLPRFGASRLSHRIVRAFFTALADPGGVAAQRPGALERAGLVLADWQHTTARLTDVESRMTAVLDAMGLTRLVCSIPGLSAVGAAVILAETGDLSRFASPRSVVKHAGLNPGEHLGDLPRPDPLVPARPAQAAAGRLARGLGRPAPQQRAARQVHSPDPPRHRPARSRPGSRGVRRRPAALAARHRHQPPAVQPRCRRRPAPRRPARHHGGGRLSPPPAHPSGVPTTA